MIVRDDLDFLHPSSGIGAVPCVLGLRLTTAPTRHARRSGRRTKQLGRTEYQDAAESARHDARRSPLDDRDTETVPQDGKGRHSDL